jgi:hypothetical protein
MVVMFTAGFQVFTVLLVAVAFALALAHASELPGKKRLPKETYIAVQQIYYPGFTIGGGVGEFGGLIAALVLAVITPRESAAFWLTVVAVVGLVVMQLVFWIWIRPVNKFWIQSVRLGRFGTQFFGTEASAKDESSGATDAGTRGGTRGPSAAAERQQLPDWTRLRDQWEYSHVVRAVLAGTSFTALVIACKVL